MQLPFQVETLTETSVGFLAAFTGIAPNLRSNGMSLIIGYANRAQLFAQRTPFEIISCGLNECEVRPKGMKVEIPPDTLRAHAIHFLIEVGFLPESERPKPANPAEEHSVFDQLAQAAA